MGNETSAHERAAALLDGHPDYRVLRALPSFGAYPIAEPQGQVRTAAVIDVETIGLDEDHPIIDLAIQRIAFDARGVIVQSASLASGSKTLTYRSRPRSPGLRGSPMPTLPANGSMPMRP